MNPNIKTSARFTGMPLQQLRYPLEATLFENKFNFMTESVSDDQIILNIKEGLIETILTLTRQKHRPLELQVEASNEPIEKSKRRSREETRNQRDGSYYYIWYLLIFGGVVISTLVYFLQAFLISIDDSSPGFSNIGINFIVLLILAVILFVTRKYWIVLFNQNTAVRNLNTRLVDITCELLNNIVKSSHTSSVIRCWSCLGETSIEAGFCSQCGAKLS